MEHAGRIEFGRTTYRIVMSSEIARCPQHRLDPQHWIPRHKTEQCRPKRRKR